MRRPSSISTLLGAFVAGLLALSVLSPAQSTADRIAGARGQQGAPLFENDSARMERLSRRWAQVKDLPTGSRDGGVIAIEGSFLKNTEERDSVLIGDQVWFGVSLKDVSTGTMVGLPVISGEDLPGIEVLSGWVSDTLRSIKVKQKKGEKIEDIDFKVLLTSFDEGDYILPRISLQRLTPTGQLDTLLFDPETLSVRTMPIDTTTFVPHDIKGQIRYPLTVEEVMPWVLAGWFVVLVAAIIICILDIRKRRGEEAEKPKEPAHITALRRLDALRGNKYWAPEKQKFFYTAVTDALRKYMVSRYGVSAMEMTTGEIFSALASSDIPDDLRKELRVLFERSDFVKFAKYTASDEENAEAVPLAVRFVTTTYQSELEELEDEKEPEEATETHKGTIPPREDDSAYMPK